MMDNQKLIETIYIEMNLKTDMAKKALEVALTNIKLFDRKQQDYGSGNISAFGEFGVIVRISDKLNRLVNLNKKTKKEQPENESILDTYKDISNYGIIGELCHKGDWK